MNEKIRLLNKIPGGRKTFIIFLTIIGALLITAVVITIGNQNKFVPAHYYLNSEQCLTRIVSNKAPEQILGPEYTIQYISMADNNKDMYIVANKSSDKQIDEKNIPTFIFYVNSWIKPKLIMEGDVHFEYRKESHKIFVTKSNGSSRELYEIEGGKCKFVMDKFWTFANNGDYLYTDEKRGLYRLYSDGKRKQISDFILSVYSTSGTDTIFYQKDGVYVSKGSDNQKIMDGWASAIYPHVDGNSAIIVSTKNDVYSYTSGTLEKLLSNSTVCMLDCNIDGSINSFDMCYTNRGNLDGVYFRNRKGESYKLFSREISWNLDMTNKKFYYIDKNQNLYSGDICSREMPEVKCIADKVTGIVSPYNPVVNQYDSYCLTSKVYGFISDGNFCPIINGSPDPDNQINAIKNRIPFKEGMIFVAKAKSASPLDKKIRYDFYYMNYNSEPKLIAKNSVSDIFFSERALYTYENGWNYITYVKESETRPGKYELYATDLISTVKISDNYTPFNVK